MVSIKKDKYTFIYKFKYRKNNLEFKATERVEIPTRD